MAIEIPERIDDLLESVRTVVDSAISDIQTHLPAIIVSYDPVAQTAVLQPAIKANQKNPDGTVQAVTLPQLLDVPVHFPSGGGMTMTFPIKAGDECLVHFGSRDMSTWWQSGGIQAPIDARTHDLSDAFCEVGVRSKAKPLAGGAHPANLELRSDDGTARISFAPGGTLVITVTGDVSITSASLHHNGKNIGATHEHSDPQGGTTGMPI